MRNRRMKETINIPAAMTAAASYLNCSNCETMSSGRISVFIGTDDLRVKEAATARCQQLISPEDAEFGLEIIEGAANDSVKDALTDAMLGWLGQRE